VGGGSARWLLIGNSRWHWATLSDGAVSCHDAAPAGSPLPPLQAWAAVGPVPPQADLPADRRLQLTDVPLGAAPAWLGIDRALAGWQAWREASSAVLVADAGTVLSLTRVDGHGRFAGGRLLAGLALQLRAMAGGTAALPRIEREGGLAAPHPDAPADPWPAATELAMVEGVRRALAAAVLAAAREVAGELAREGALPDNGLRLVLTGGDGPALAPLIAEALVPQDPVLILRPALCLEGLMALRPLRPERDP
jgi:type III pantothenate kinase